jgi:hypothetical protein
VTVWEKREYDDTCILSLETFVDVYIKTLCIKKSPTLSRKSYNLSLLIHIYQKYRWFNLWYPILHKYISMTSLLALAALWRPLMKQLLLIVQTTWSGAFATVNDTKYCINGLQIETANEATNQPPPQCYKYISKWSTCGPAVMRNDTTCCINGGLKWKFVSLRVATAPLNVFYIIKVRLIHYITVSLQRSGDLFSNSTSFYPFYHIQNLVSWQMTLQHCIRIQELSNPEISKVLRLYDIVYDENLWEYYKPIGPPRMSRLLDIETLQGVPNDYKLRWSTHISRTFFLYTMTMTARQTPNNNKKAMTIPTIVPVLSLATKRDFEN